MDAIIAMLGGVRAAVFAAIAAALLILAGVQSVRYELAEAKRETAQTKLDSAIAANGTNETTITELRSQNAAWSKACSFNYLEQAGVLPDYNTAALTIKAENDKASAKLAEVYKHVPAARDWASTRIPPDVLARLRE